MLENQCATKRGQKGDLQRDSNWIWTLKRHIKYYTANSYYTWVAAITGQDSQFKNSSNLEVGIERKSRDTKYIWRWESASHHDQNNQVFSAGIQDDFHHQPGWNPGLQPGNSITIIIEKFNLMTYIHIHPEQLQQK